MIQTQSDILSIGLEIQFTILRFDKMVQGNDLFFESKSYLKKKY